MFFYIFGFSFYKGTGIDSSMIVFIYLFLYSLFSKRMSKRVASILCSKYFLNIAILYIFINLYALIICIINESDDYSFLMTFLHMFFLIVEGFFLYAFYKIRGTERNILNYLVAVFCIQSLIEWSAFLFSPVKDLINFTKSEATILRGMGYSGVRANSLASSDFFGLSAAFAIVYLLFFSRQNGTLKLKPYINILIYGLLLTGTFFAGRTGYVGVLIAMIYIVKSLKIKKISWNFFRNIGFALIGILTLGGMSVFFLDAVQTSENFENLYNFTFQLFISLTENNSAKISTLQSLESMYFFVNPYTFFLGDSFYSNPDGSYYMHTDVGYMRTILYMGIFGTIFLLMMQLLIIRPFRGNEKVLKLFLVILLLILNLKGEVIVWGQITLTVVTIYSINNYFNKIGEIDG